MLKATRAYGRQTVDPFFLVLELVAGREKPHVPLQLSESFDKVLRDFKALKNGQVDLGSATREGLFLYALASEKPHVGTQLLHISDFSTLTQESASEIVQAMEY